MVISIGIHQEMLIKTTMRSYLALVKIAIIKENTNNKCWQGCGENSIRIHSWWECKLVQSLWKIVWWSFKKLKEVELPYESAVSLLQVHPNKQITLIWKDTCTPVFMFLLFFGWWVISDSCDPMDCSPLGSYVQRISKTRILEWVAISFSRRSSWPWDQTHVSCIDRQILYHWATKEALPPLAVPTDQCS